MGSSTRKDAGSSLRANNSDGETSVCSFVRLFVYSFVRLFVYSFVRLFVCSFVRLFVCSFVRLFVCSFVRLFVCSFIRLFVCSFVRFYWSNTQKLLNVLNVRRAVNTFYLSQALCDIFILIY